MNMNNEIRQILSKIFILTSINSPGALPELLVEYLLGALVGGDAPAADAVQLGAAGAHQRGAAGRPLPQPCAVGVCCWTSMLQVQVGTTHKWTIKTCFKQVEI